MNDSMELFFEASLLSKSGHISHFFRQFLVTHKSFGLFNQILHIFVRFFVFFRIGRLSSVALRFGVFFRLVFIILFLSRSLFRA